MVESFAKTIKNVPLRIIRAQRREGLIRGRLLGARSATGDLLVFLDSHCEVNNNWLPPLIERIVEGNQTRVVCPVIDLINSHTFRYTASPLVRGGFTWGLGFSWEPIPNDGKRNPSVDPFKYVTFKYV